MERIEAGMQRRSDSAGSSEKGAVAVMIAFMIVTVLGFAALAVDVGYMMVARNELQNIADASALAAARKLGVLYEGMTHTEQKSYVCDPAVLADIAQEVALNNQAAGIAIDVDFSDIQVGIWRPESGFSATLNQPDAVRVTARRQAGSNGPVGTFFAQILGIDTVPVAACATAALTGASTADPGTLDMPVGIAIQWFNKAEFCDQPIKFYPTGTLEGCAGWNTFIDSPSNASKLRDILRQLAQNTYTSPEAFAGQTFFVFTGGNVASAFEDMRQLYEAKRNPATGEWRATVVVYDMQCADNPTGFIRIVGFATAIVTGVKTSPSNEITAKVVCDTINEGRGGGNYYGTKGSIPGLVDKCL